MGGVWYEAGSQKNSGKTAALIPNAIRNSIEIDVTRPGASVSASRTDRSARFSVPVTPYSSPMAAKKPSEPTRLIIT